MRNLDEFQLDTLILTAEEQKAVKGGSIEEDIIT